MQKCSPLFFHTLSLWFTFTNSFFPPVFIFFLAKCNVYCFWSFVDDTFHLNNADSNKYYLWTWYCFIKIYLTISFHIRSSSSAHTQTHAHTVKRVQIHGSPIKTKTSYSSPIVMLFYIQTKRHFVHLQIFPLCMWVSLCYADELNA